MERRTALRALAILSATSLAPSLLFSKDTKNIAFKLEQIEKLQKTGGWAILKIRERQIMFVRDKDDSIKAINPVCTHKNCTVEYHPDVNLIICPCHGSTFNLDGTVVKKPASEPLQTYPARIYKGRVVVKVPVDE